MEILIQSVPELVALILPVVFVLMVITNIIVEVLKKMCWDKLPTNILVFVVAVTVTLLALLSVCQITGVTVVWHMVVGAIVLGIFVAYAAMFGFDKLRQTLEQLDGIKNVKSGPD